MIPSAHPLLVRAEMARRLEEARAHHQAAQFRSHRVRWWPRPGLVAARVRHPRLKIRLKIRLKSRRRAEVGAATDAAA